MNSACDPAPGDEILCLGYVGVRSGVIEDWRDFGSRLLGMEFNRHSRGTASFRMDGAAHRLLLRDAADEGLDYSGWMVRDPVALQSLAARLEANGHPVSRLPAEMLDLREVTEGFSVIDPIGNRLEFFYGQAQAEKPFESGRPIMGFRTGALGMGHVVLNVPDINQVLPFYRDILGFRLSDYTQRPFRAYFFHVNARHHSLALIESKHPGIHHLMVELTGLDDVGQGYDLAQLEPGRVAATLGRHSNDHMFSFYMRTPSRFLIEYGWGGRDIDLPSWQSMEMVHGPSLWGHDRDWLSDDLKAEAKRLRLAAAAQGERAPLRVWAGEEDRGVWSDVPDDDETRTDAREK